MSRPPLLLVNGTIVTVDAQRRVFPDGFVHIVDGRIAAVGTMADVPADAEGAEKIDCAGCLVTPGLINMHQHHWYTLFKGLADGYLLEDWITGFVFPLVKNLSVDAMRLSSTVNAMEMLATGTTCSLNHSVTSTDEATVTAIMQAHAEAGIRHVFGKDFRCRTRGNPNHPLSLDKAVAATEALIARWHGANDGLARIALAIEASAHWTAAGMSTDELVKAGYDLACRHDLRITSHISGGTLALDMGFLKHLRETGRTDVRYLMELGVLDHHWLLIHGIHVTDTDLDHMAEVRASFVYTPSSESMRGGGIAPFSKAQRQGLLVSLGTDGPMVDYSVDMVEQMKVCAMMQHVRHLDPTRMPVELTLEMATINAATSLGMADEIGSLDVGKRADVAVFDMRKPHIGVLNRPLSTFVCAGHGSDATCVIVDGRVVFRDGSFANIPDWRAVLDEASALATSIVHASGLGSRYKSAWRPYKDARRGSIEG